MTVKAPAVKARNNALKDTRGDKIFFAINACILGILALIILYPLYFIVIASISDPDAVLGGQVVLAPVNITFEGFEKVFQRGDIWQGYLNTIIYTVVDHTRRMGTEPQNHAREEILDDLFHYSDVLRRRPDSVL